MKQQCPTCKAYAQEGVYCSACPTFYTADQLRAAQVAILREAADWFSKKQHNEYANPDDELFRMADELSLPTALHEIPKREDGINAAGGTLSNPDEAADTPQTPR